MDQWEGAATRIYIELFTASGSVSETEMDCGEKKQAFLKRFSRKVWLNNVLQAAVEAWLHKTNVVGT